MNGITGKLKPEKLWYYFEQISAIPRPSGREHKVIDYLVRFAEQRGLKYQKDQKGNVVIVKPPSPGYETRPAVVLQAHVDMVCEKNASVSHNCDTDPIQLKISDDWITADGTSLGADNGLGAAAMLCLLQDDA
ncbi:MAG: cytosol nonspecific dipeptidase, partial [Spirochaetota bacterium]